MKEMLFLVLSKLIKKSQISARRNCSVHKSSKLMAGGLYYNVNVGRYSYTGYGCNIVNCSIGGFCSIANDVNIGGGGHPLSHVSTSPVFYDGNNILRKVFYPHRFESEKKSVIGHDVWIGYGAIVISGVNIGTGAVIGAGSVVTKDVPPYEIWAGNPASLIRPRFNQEVIDGLINSEWWNKSDAWISERANLFVDTEKFLDSL